MNNPLKKYIEIIKTGSSEEVKEAQKQIKKYWHDVYIPKRVEGKKVFTIFLDEIKKFEEISDINHQSYLINVLKWPLWAIGEKYFEVWADFLLTYVQHPSGKIRQAIIRASDYLIMDIVVDIRDMGNNKNNQKRMERIAKNKMRFGFFVYAVEQLLEKYEEPKFRRYKYVSNMPVGVYKSLQILITEQLLRSEYYEKMYEEFLQNNIKIPRPQIDASITKEQILNRREEIERELTEWIKKTNCDLSFRKIQEIIYYEKSQKDLHEIMRAFDKAQDMDEMNAILKVVSEAWNYYPHRCLNDLSPAEKFV
ncbi:hypothetical protein KAJ89_04120 [Candidatus Parcubacteria bacterium]|nr:hypothetical protein [Candidatus Parcubacteria bacterium]